MNQVTNPIFHPINGVFHPTDFTEASRVAFHHALKAAFLATTDLTLMHVAPGGGSEWLDFPGVRETLEKWGWLPPGSPRTALPELGIQVRKVVSHQSDPVKAVLHYLERHPADLMVLATHQHEGRVRWFHQSVAEPVARQAAQMTLFIPGGSRGFVCPDDGSVALTNILIPVAAVPRAQSAVAAAARMAARMNCPQGTFTLLHVGGGDEIPDFSCPGVPGWEWKTATRSGDVIEQIIHTAEETKAGLIVMATDGRHGFLDALRGSHSERVLRHAAVPLLTVPSGTLAAGFIP